MEAPLGQKQRPHEFPSITLSHLSSPAPSSASASASASASFAEDNSGCPRLRIHQLSSPDPVFDLDLQNIQIFKLGPLELLCASEETGGDDSEEKSFSRAFKIGFGTKVECKSFYSACEQWKLGVVGARTGEPLANGRLTVPKSKFDNKIDTTSAKMYFHYYGQLLHQQNMLQDYVRTGTLLVNERMLETYVIARDRFLIPDGKMFPSLGRIHMAPFSDEYLYVEIANKALFWQQHNYYGVDLTPLYGSAFQGYFSQPVVDAFDPRLLVSPPIIHTLDFTSMKEEDLYEIDIPLNFVSSVGTRVHGLACWFDVLFNGSSVQRWLTTAPGAPTTHWYQLRCVLAQPIYVMAGQEITGRFHLVSHSAQSYTIFLTMSAKMWGAGAEQGGILQTSSCKFDLKEPYYRLSQPQPYVLQQDQQSNQQLMQSQEISPSIQDGTGPSIAVIPSHIPESLNQ